ncbi:MAG TPA: questin oxidase family protein [Mycobacteriales bacterium]
MTDGALLDALDRLRGTGPEFHGFLANHGPMASEALVRLGAADRVGGWVSGYLPKLDDAPRVVRGIGVEDWPEHLGDARLAGDWTAYLRQEAGATSWRELLLRWWPRLLPGLAASATHGVIRTAHAVRSLRAAGEEPEPLLVDELAQGLALWAARYQRLPGDPRLSGPLPAVPAVAALPRLRPDVPDDGDGIAGRLRVLPGLDGYAGSLNAWGPPADPDAALDELIGAAARVLAARSDAPIAFCHAVTAPAAVRMVLPELPPALRTASVAASWQAVGGIVAAFASPRLPAESDPAPGDPAELVGRAVEHGDEHVIKLTEAALREHARTGDETLLVAADRFRDRIPADG